MPLIVEQEGENETGTCACCGKASRAVWGVVSDDRRAAAYHVHWTDGHLMEFGSAWTILIGRWGDGTSAADRSIVSIDLRHDEPRGMTVIDPSDETVARYSSLAANAFTAQRGDRPADRSRCVRHLRCDLPAGWVHRCSIRERGRGPLNQRQAACTYGRCLREPAPKTADIRICRCPSCPPDQ